MLAVAAICRTVAGLCNLLCSRLVTNQLSRDLEPTEGEGKGFPGHHYKTSERGREIRPEQETMDTETMSAGSKQVVT